VAANEKRVLSMLTILVATCETTLHALQVADNPVDTELMGLLEKVIERTRVEIDALTAPREGRAVGRAS
jgi:hypothetical protein